MSTLLTINDMCTLLSVPHCAFIRCSGRLSCHCLNWIVHCVRRVWDAVCLTAAPRCLAHCGDPLSGAAVQPDSASDRTRGKEDAAATSCRRSVVWVVQPTRRGLGYTPAVHRRSTSTEAVSSVSALAEERLPREPPVKGWETAGC